MLILTQTSTMPGSSFSLPARRTCPGAFFSRGSVCSVCYADERKRYRWKSVKRAQSERLAWTIDALRSGIFVPVVVGHILARPERYLRLHDAGDFFSSHYVEAWIEIARSLPLVRFWAPTHSWAFGGQPRADSDPLLASLRRLAALPNITVRPSAINIGDDPPRVPGLAAGSTVTVERSLATCLKFLRHPPACGDCRRCWDEPLVSVVYLKH